MQWLRWAVPPFLVMVLGMACAKPPPGTLRAFHRGRLKFWAIPQGGPQHHLAFGPSHLGTLPTEPLFDPLTNPADLVSVELHGPPPTPVVFKTLTADRKPGPDFIMPRQKEVHLEVRDPAEIFGRLTRLGQDDDAWQAETRVPGRAPSPWTLPLDVVIPYPAAPQFPLVDPTTLSPVAVEHFWTRHAPALRTGPGARPGGWSSIKHIRVTHAGLCSTELPIQEVLDEIGTQVQWGYLEGACKPGFNAKSHFINATSFVSYAVPGDNPLVRNGSFLGGGFLLQARVWLHDAGGAFPASLRDCDMWAIYAYDFVLIDGHLALLSALQGEDYAKNRALCTGPPGQSGLADAVTGALKNDLPSRFNETASNRQRRVLQRDVKCRHDGHCPTRQPCNLATGFCADSFDCDMEAVRSGARSIQDVCRSAITRVSLAAGIGAESVLGISKADAATLITKVAEGENWHCVPGDINVCSSVKPRGRCAFEFRAKRIVVHPDTVELVWFDDENDFTNPNLGIFAATFAEGDMNAYTELCSRRPKEVPTPFDPATNFFTRRYATFHAGEATCEDRPPAFVPPPPVCRCARDEDCRSKECDRAIGACANICWRREDCPQGHECIDGLCGGNPCGQQPELCKPYEHCDAGGWCLRN